MDVDELRSALPSWTTGLEVCASPRRLVTATLELTQSRKVVVRVPPAWQEAQVRALLLRRQPWLQAQHQGMARYEPRSAPRACVAGESHRHLGQQLMLVIEAAPAGREGVRVEGGQLCVAIKGEARPERIAALLRAWRLRQAREVFGLRLERCLAHHVFWGLAAPKLQLRTMERRWGSLSPGGVLTLNPLLVQASSSAIDCVIRHELCHLRHRQHSPQFFALMDQVHPGWKAERARLELMLA